METIFPMILAKCLMEILTCGLLWTRLISRRNESLLASVTSMYVFQQVCIPVGGVLPAD